MHKHKVRASVLNDAHKKGNTAFVIATAGDTLPKVVTASYGCSSCGATFASVAGMEPFCVSCGSHEVKANTEQQAPALPEDSDEIVAVRCSSCGAYNGMHAETASALGGHVHCVECGADMQYDAQEVGSSEQTTENHKPNEEPVKVTTPADGTKVNTPAAPSQTVVIEASDLSENPSQQFQTEVSLVAATLGCENPGALSLDKRGDTLVAYIGKTPVAVLSKDQADAPMQQVFDTESLVAAILDNAEQQGVEQALNQYKFEPIKVRLPVDPFVNQLAQEQIQKVQQQQAEHSDDLLQCVSIAATALAKNIFKGKEPHALKAGFSSLLASCGVKNAEAAVERVFAANADAYHQQLFQTALELQQKPVDYRNTLTEALKGMNPVVASDEEGDDEGTVDTGTLPIRLENASIRPAVKASKPPVVASSIRALAAQTGGTLFG